MKCEGGCKKKAEYCDSEGVPLCSDCFIQLYVEEIESLKEELRVLKEKGAEAPSPTSAGPHDPYPRRPAAAQAD